MGKSINVNRFLHRPPVIGMLLGLVVFGAVLALRGAGLLQPLELEAYDLMLRFHQDKQEINPQLALIIVSEADIQELGHWPLSDELLAETLDKLQAHGPAVVGVDIYRDIPVPPGSERLGRVLSGFPNIVMIDKFGDDASPGVASPALLRGTDQVGFSDILVDSDGVVRRGLLFLDDGVKVSYSLSLRMALHYLRSMGIVPRPGKPDATHLRLGDVTLRPFESSDGGYTNADAAGYQVLLDYRGGSQPFPVYSLGELRAGDIPADDLTGRVVILGVAADSVKDYFLTPYRRGMDAISGVPGSVIHAHVASQLLRSAIDGEKPLAVLDDAMEHAWTLLWTAAGVILVLLFRPVGRFITAAISGTLLLLLLPYMAFINGLWLPVVPAAIGWLATAALMTAYLSSHENAQRRHIMELFSRQVSSDVAEQIWEQREHFMADGRLAARRVTATVLFSDLEDFTPVAERLGPLQLMDWLNRYMEIMATLVLDYNGIIDDYFGDAIMADFGVPLERCTEVEFDRDARNAVDCALAMRGAIAQLNIENRKRSLPPVSMRVGICTGEMMAGFIGTARRMKYTTIGDAVNTAARLESFGKEITVQDPREAGCRILVSASTAKRLGTGFKVEAVGQISLKGKSKPVEVFRVIGKNGLTGEMVPES